jgi:hypothetical protein
VVGRPPYVSSGRLSSHMVVYPPPYAIELKE